MQHSKSRSSYHAALEIHYIIAVIILTDNIRNLKFSLILGAEETQHVPLAARREFPKCWNFEWANPGQPGLATRQRGGAWAAAERHHSADRGDNAAVHLIPQPLDSGRAKFAAFHQALVVLLGLRV